MGGIAVNMKTVLERIEDFNQRRNSQLLQLKYQKMQNDTFAFFRGTCHLFYEDWPQETTLNVAPAVWACGDLHLENFGSYKGDNRLVYFDINDFDEAVLAPCTWDLARFLTSVLIGTRSLEIGESDALALCQCFLETYRQTLAKGQVRTLERETAQGMVKDLLMSLRQRDRKSFLDERTDLTKNQRRLKIDNKRTMAIAQPIREKITNLIETWGAQQPNPKFFQVLDVAHRIAGTSSLGLERYVVLVEGKGSPNQNYLLDLKAAIASSLHPQITQPQWTNEATRVFNIEQRVQGMPPALIAILSLDEQSYLLRELQPTQDRLSLKQAKGKSKRLETVINTMAKLVAWGQLRSGGRQGSAIADELIAFAQDDQWQEPLLSYVLGYRHKVEEDFQSFRESYGKKSGGG
jgi:uncharacterized protein (DUF2252 family)